MTLREIGRSVGESLLENAGRAAGRLQERRPIAADLLESEEAYLAVFDAPGATAGDVQVRYDDGTVLVRVDRFREFYPDFEMRFPGRGLALDGSVELPEGAVVDPNGATATLRDNGTLEVEIPKREGGEDADSTRGVDVDADGVGEGDDDGGGDERGDVDVTDEGE
jgi:HSP20 family molecular chaperone IbpA